MAYTINKLARLAGVSVRTLHYYDEVGLLSPARIQGNGYRLYEEDELLKLQQILFFRELEFPLDEIKRIVTDPHFNMTAALRDQKKLIELKKNRLTGLIRTIDKTIKKINKETTMEDKELYDGLSDAKMKEYAQEAKERWGNTEAYKQSQERVKKMSKEDMVKIQKDGEELLKKIVLVMNRPADSSDVQALITEHYNNLRTFYEPSLEMYRGLGDMYVNDSRFTVYFEKFGVGLAQFMRDAMHVYSHAQSK